MQYIINMDLLTDDYKVIWLYIPYSDHENDNPLRETVDRQNYFYIYHKDSPIPSVPKSIDSTPYNGAPENFLTYKMTADHGELSEDEITFLSALNTDCIAYYISLWDTDVLTDGCGFEKKSSGSFLSVKTGNTGFGIGAYLYILNALLAEEHGIFRHEADFSVDINHRLGATQREINTKNRAVFNKIYGKLGLTLAPQPAAEMYGDTRVMSGQIVRRMFCNQYVQIFPCIYNTNSNFCDDYSGGKRTQRKNKKNKKKSKKRHSLKKRLRTKRRHLRKTKKTKS